MDTIVGPVLARNGGYAFDTWEQSAGLRPGFTYRRLEDARYARNAALNGARSGRRAVECGTLDQFIAATSRHEPLSRAA